MCSVNFKTFAKNIRKYGHSWAASNWLYVPSSRSFTTRDQETIYLSICAVWISKFPRVTRRILGVRHRMYITESQLLHKTSP